MDGQLKNKDKERGNLPPLQGLLFSISSKRSFICTIPQTVAHTMAFVIPTMAGMRNNYFNKDRDIKFK